MSVAYLDTSALVAVLFGEPGGAALGARLGNFSQVVSSNLLEAEIRSVMHREEQVYSDDLLVGIKWILPERPLGPEFKTVLEAGYLRGADLWHLATALYLADDPKELSFRDPRQTPGSGCFRPGLPALTSPRAKPSRAGRHPPP